MRGCAKHNRGTKQIFFFNVYIFTLYIYTYLFTLYFTRHCLFVFSDTSSVFFVAKCFCCLPLLTNSFMSYSILFSFAFLSLLRHVFPPWKPHLKPQFYFQQAHTYLTSLLAFSYISACYCFLLLFPSSSFFSVRFHALFCVFSLCGLLVASCGSFQHDESTCVSAVALWQLLENACLSFGNIKNMFVCLCCFLLYTEKLQTSQRIGKESNALTFLLQK